MSTSTDGRPSVGAGRPTDPEPDAAVGPPPAAEPAAESGRSVVPVGSPAVGSEPDDAVPDDAVPSESGDPLESSGPGWVHAEIRRRIAEGGAASGGRHARRGRDADPLTGSDYAPRHAGRHPGRPAATPVAPTETSPTETSPPATPPTGVRPSVHITPLPAADGAAAGFAPAPPVVTPRDQPPVPVPVARNAGPGSLPPGHPSLRPAPVPAPRTDSDPAGPAPGPVVGSVADHAVTDTTIGPGSVAVDPAAATAANPATAADPADGPQRIRVVLAERRSSTRAVRTVDDVTDGTGVGDLLRRDLIGSQLAVALRFGIGTVLVLGLLPLVFMLYPALGRVELLGLRLPWLVIGFVLYVGLFLAGLWYARTAERVERDFADHVQE